MPANMKKLRTNKFQRYALISVFFITILSPSFVFAIDIYEPDDIYTDAKEIQIEGLPQEHDFHVADDKDWVRFNIPTNSMTVDIVVNNPGSNCDAVIELYDTNGTTLTLPPHNETGPGEGEELRWSFEESGDYYVKVYSNAFGVQTNYELSILEVVGVFLVLVTGMVTDSISGDPIEGALIKIDNDASTNSLPDGAYLIMHLPGTFTITGEAPGYGLSTYPNVVIAETGTTTLDISLIPLGIDSDGDGIDDHEDNCPNTINPDQENFDKDGLGDVCDGCPMDHNKAEPGVCDCGVADSDADGDGIADCIDGSIGNERGGVGRGSDCFISTMKH